MAHPDECGNAGGVWGRLEQRQWGSAGQGEQGGNNGTASGGDSVSARPGGAATGGKGDSPGSGGMGSDPGNESGGASGESGAVGVIGPPPRFIWLPPIVSPRAAEQRYPVQIADASDDGFVVVGASSYEDSATSLGQGVRVISDVLTAAGIDLGGAELTEANRVWLKSDSMAMIAGRAEIDGQLRVWIAWLPLHP
jgi:hypothetical protein